MKLSFVVLFSIGLSAQLLVAETGKGQTARTSAALLENTAIQEKKITIGSENENLRDVLRKIQKLSGYRIAFPSEEVSRYTNINLPKDTRTVAKTLQLVLALTIFDFTYKDNTIVLYKKENDPPGKAIETQIRENKNSSSPPVVIKGRVVDDKSGEPISDAAVMIKGVRIGVNSNREGEFSFNYDGGGTILLIVSHIGYAEKEVALQSGGYLTIRMVVSDQTLANVEISTGMFKRKKESFTGATASFTGDQLRAIGSRSVIESLKTLDPSFIVVENNLAGSNPNALPTIELRGKTSISTSSTSTNDLNGQFASDPNLPLFVLNGFPTTLAIINNLDMSRVSSVTILKDAASTAFWGSKAANGVVVIETKRPIAGELRIGYSADFLVDAPDLSSYNMMNSSEKLQFEKLAGLYDSKVILLPQYDLDRLYNQRLASVERGVNTYWLSEPVQTGFTNKHSLQLSGGNNDLLFGAGVSYTGLKGAMKGSNRQTWGGNFDLTYRKGKLNITDQLYLSGYTANASPYGSFSDFVSANPYFAKRNSDGTIPRYIDSIAMTANPLYNASLSSINQTKNFDVRNSLQGIWTFNTELWLQGGFQLSRGSTTTIVFNPPENTGFDGTDPTNKGTYTNYDAESRRYDGNLTLTYAKLFGTDHMLNANLRSDISQETNRSLGFKAIGFPNGTNGNPAFAFKYDPYTTPTASSSIARTVSAGAILNYAYKMRYLFDFVYTVNGSNAFGTDHKTAPSWSVGLGWNLHKEAIFRQWSWINLLKLRANFGVVGNQELGLFSSNSVYTAIPGSNPFGQSLDLASLGNPGLKWQNTRTLSTGVDITVLNNRVSATVNYYEKNTDPLIVSTSGVLPASVGLQFPYPINVGRLLDKGWEANLRVSPVYQVKKRIVWTLGLTGTVVKARYGGIGNSLADANKQQLQSSGLSRYQDGYSPDDLWAVISRGIDPATGQEIFQKKDGTQTFNYFSDDIVRVGNARPKVQGVISSFLTYKGLSLNLNLRYQLGGSQFNTAVYNKVENIGQENIKYNQDKRALYDRWQKPGDIAQFKGIALNKYTPISSRFIQQDNILSGESISLGWDFYASSWIHRLKMQGLRAYVITNNLFRLSEIKAERGIEYPFVRTVSFGLNASF